ncbi:MAG: Rieske 2Fe-2S domain-containing protein [Acidobacteriota bacterium]
MNNNKEVNIPRRSFIDYLLGGSILALIASVLYPTIKFIMPPKVPEASQSSVKAAKVGELAPNSYKIFRMGTKPGILIHTEDGKFIAMSAVCTHLGCIIQYRPDMQHVWCACHNGHFDLNGKVISGPPPLPLEVFQVNIVGDEIIVSKKG